MTLYLITYDLNKETKRPPITKEFKDNFSSWAKVSESCYIVNINKSVDLVYDQISKYIDDNDQLYVIEIKPTRSWKGFGPKDINQWLENNLPTG